MKNPKTKLLIIAIMLLFLIGISAPVQVYGQLDNNAINRLKALRTERDSNIENKDQYITKTNDDVIENYVIENVKNSTNKISYTQIKDLGQMSDKEFQNECAKFISQGDASIPQGADFFVAKSCRKEGNKVVASFYMEVSENRLMNRLKEWNSDIQAQEEEQQRRQEIEKELRKVRNTQKMYQNMIDALEKELAENGIYVIDKGLGIVIRNIEIDSQIGEEIKKLLEKAKETAIKEAKKKYGLEDRKPIENKNAEFFEGAISISEDIFSLVPHGDKITNHYLWRIYSNTPDLGRILGNGAACIKIYARIDELRKEQNALKAREIALTNKLRK